MANQIVSLKVDLSEANDLRDSLIEKRDRMLGRLDALNDSERHQLGRIDTLLRRDFAWTDGK